MSPRLPSSRSRRRRPSRRRSRASPPRLPLRKHRKPLIPESWLCRRPRGTKVRRLRLAPGWQTRPRPRARRLPLRPAPCRQVPRPNRRRPPALRPASRLPRLHRRRQGSPISIRQRRLGSGVRWSDRRILPGSTHCRPRRPFPWRSSPVISRLRGRMRRPDSFRRRPTGRLPPEGRSRLNPFLTPSFAVARIRRTFRRVSEGWSGGRGAGQTMRETLPGHASRSGNLSGWGEQPPPRSGPFGIDLIEPVRLPAAGRAVAALRAFTAGDGFLPGQVIDRLL